MLQIDHVYEFLSSTLFKDFEVFFCPNGVVQENKDITIDDLNVFNPSPDVIRKIMFYDQEPMLENIANRYLDVFAFPDSYTLEELLDKNFSPPYKIKKIPDDIVEYLIEDTRRIYREKIIVTSEHSKQFDYYAEKYNAKKLYYFFHGFAALDWYRGYYALNYDKTVIKPYNHDFISFNRIITHDRSYRIYWASKLAELKLLAKGQISFNVTDNVFDDWRDEVADPNTKLSEHARQHSERYLTDISKLVIDRAELPGSISANILREADALWNVVTETVFYYNKLHLTEKIFKPIVSKQPFMLIAAPGNLEYLRSYGFKTFDGIIDESYDKIVDNDARIDAVAEQLRWYCNLSAEEKSRVIERLAPIVEYNFHHFYGAFKHIITKELLNNCCTLFKEIGYDDSNIAYDQIYRVLTN